MYFQLQNEPAWLYNLMYSSLSPFLFLSSSSSTLSALFSSSNAFTDEYSTTYFFNSNDEAESADTTGDGAPFPK